VRLDRVNDGSGGGSALSRLAGAPAMKRKCSIDRTKKNMPHGLEILHG
jgi:hypothetical protein